MVACALLGLGAAGSARAQDISNTATITAPAGVTDGNSANNSATDTDQLFRAVAITKIVTGAPASGAPGQYDFSVQCSTGTYADSAVLTGNQTSSSGLVYIPVGATGCAILETGRSAPPANYTWGAASYVNPPSPIPATGAVTGTITNPLSANPGSLTVTKTIAGATSPTALTFPVSVTCATPTATYTTSITVPANAGTASATIANVPAGTTNCQISEGARPAPPDGYEWGPETYTQPDPAALPAGGAASGAIENPLVALVPAQTVAKSDATLQTDADGSGGITEGDTLAYTVTVTNTGDVPLTNVVIDDAQLTPASQTCASVPVNGTCVLSGTHVVTAAEAQAGSVVNTASVTSAEIPGPTNSNTVTTTVSQVPEQTVAKSDAALQTDADGSGGITEGDTLAYTVTVTNTGDLPLTNVVIDDAQLTPASQACPSVAVGGTCVLSGTHVVSAAEAQAGSVVNTASVASNEIPVSTNSNTVTTAVNQIPGQTVEKSDATLAADADGSGGITEGDTLAYTVTVTNTGDVPLTNVVIDDAQLAPASQACSSVPVGGTCVLSGTHVVTAAEAQAGSVVNTASVASTEIPGPTNSNTVTTAVDQVPEQAVVKSDATLQVDADGSGGITEGDTLGYTVTVTNTGDVPLTNVVIDDAQLTPASQSCANVPVGGTCVLSGTHVVTAAEAQAGSVVNTASVASAEIPGPTPSNTVTTTVDQVPAQQIGKSTAILQTDADGSGGITGGDTLAYTVTLTNTGDLPLTNVVINDAQLAPASQTCANVPVGGTCVLNGTHVVSDAEAQAGEVVNTASVTSAEIPGPTNSNTVTTTVNQVPGQTAVKSGAILQTDADGSGGVTEGDTLAYTVTMTNTGDVPLTNVVIDDAQLTPASQNCASVPVGGACVLSGTHVVTAAEAQAGSVVNTASVASTEIPGPTPTNTVTTTVDQVPEQTVAKSDATLQTDADGSGGITEGDTLAYTVTVTNTGDVPLTNVVVNDAQLAPASQTCPNVPVGGTCVLAGTHVVTAAEAQAGSVVNTASATSTEVPGPTSSNTVTTSVNQVPEQTVAKSGATLQSDADGSGGITEGDTLAYTVTVTNTGDVPLTNVVVNDARLTPDGLVCANVPVSGTCVLSGTHVVTAAEAQAGEVVNTASATSNESPGPTDSNTVITPVDQVPDQTVVKSDATLQTDADGSGGITEDDTLAYTVTVTNTGDVPLTNVVINDARLTPASQTCANVPVGGTCVLGGTHVVTAAEAQAGRVVNTASTSSNQIPGPTPSNTVTTAVDQVPGQNVVKSDPALQVDADGSGGITEGDTLAYTITVTNTGDLALTNVVIDDARLTPASQTCPSVAVGGTCVLSGTHVVSAAEAQAGSVVNTASVTSTEIPAPTPSNTVTTTVNQVPEQTVVKSDAALQTDADGSGGVTEGDTLAYTVTVTNTGDVPLTNVVIDDARLTPASQSCASVPVGGTCVLSGTHVVTAAEAQAGSVVNTASVTSTEIPGPAPSNTVTTTVDQVPEQTVVKSGAALQTDADGSGGITEGDTLAYTVTVTNTGDVPLTNVVVDDARLTPASQSCANVPVGGTCVLSGTHVVTAAEAQAGSVVNTASVASTEIPGPTGSNTVTTAVDQVPEQAVVKSDATLQVDADGSGGITEGDTLAYTVTVTNTGDVPLTNVVIDDAQLTPASQSCANVPVGGTCVLSGTHVVTAAEAQAGSVVNTASVASTEIPGPTNSNTVTTAVDQVPEQTVIKSDATLQTDADGSGGITEGDALAYTVTVTNTGDVPLTNVVINDAQLTPASQTCASVPVNGACVLSGTHVVTAAEAQAGSVVNTASVASTEIPGPTNSNTVTTAVDQVPEQTLIKSNATLQTDADGSGGITEGDTLAYTVTVTNTGDLPLTDLVIDDAQLTPASQACPSVAVGGTCVLSGTHVVTLAEAQAGSVVNTASATSNEIPGPVASNTVTTAVEQRVIAAGDDSAAVAQNTAVTIPVLGNDTLNGAPASPADVTVTQATSPANGTVTIDAGGTIRYTPAPGFSGTDTFTYTVCENANPANCATATVSVTVEANSVAANGDSGTVSPGGSVATDVLANDTTTGAPLDPASVTVTAPPANGTVTCDDAGICTYTPNPGFSGTDSYAYRVCDTSTPTPVCDTATVAITVTAPSLSVEKTAGEPVDANGNGIVDAGDTIAYSFAVANTGDVELQAVVVNDPKISAAPIACAPATVPAGATAACGPATYTITEADVAAGSVENSATATGTPVGGTPVTSEPDGTSTPTTAPAPALSSSKAQTGNDDADGSGDVSLGDSLTFVVTVTNTGNVPLRNVVVGDAMLTPDSIACATVAPGGSCVLTGTYTVAQADVDAGRIVNTASVRTDPPPGRTLPPEACPAGAADADCAPSVTIPVVQHPSVAVEKTAALTTDGATPGVGNTGDVITYTVTVTNTGDVTLTDIAVVDTMEGGAPVTLDCPLATLAPGATAACASYTHTITASEANGDGTLDNDVAVTGQPPAGGSQPATGSATASVEVEPDPTQVRIVKQAAPRDVRIGDLVRYTLTLDNVGEFDVVDASLVDTPPAGFTLVEGSLDVADRDAAGRQVGSHPIRVDQIDIAAGDRATVTYLLRVGAGVRGGLHVNSVELVDNGQRVSNVATASVQLVADPLMDESLIMGTVFDDRDGDGWQDSAAMTGVRVQGGFAPQAYVAGSTTVDRGHGPQPEPDASAPLLHGIAVGDIGGRQSEADPAAAHRVVVSQTLSSLDFSDDFLLTTRQGLRLRMDAAGNTTVESGEGDAARGLTAAMPKVERNVARIGNGYRVDYVIDNAGVDERGIPGVRIASVEGLLMETDQFGRYHVVGIDGGRAERGRNFILKVDAATLPPGTTFTTDNPLVRRITPGLPVRFDFGVKLPPGLVEGGTQPVEMEIGEVLFEPGSAQLRGEYLGAIERMAEQVRSRGAGEVAIATDGESQALAYGRATAVRDALVEKLTPEQAAATTISLRTDLGDRSGTALSLGRDAGGNRTVLGTLLFDTDSAEIRAEFAPLLDAIAADIARRGGAIGVVGHADRRGSDAYNVALGLRRAKAVYEAIAARLPQEARSRLRVEVSDDPTAPVGQQRR